MPERGVPRSDRGHFPRVPRRWSMLKNTLLGSSCVCKRLVFAAEKQVVFRGTWTLFSSDSRPWLIKKKKTLWTSLTAADRRFNWCDGCPGPIWRVARKRDLRFACTRHLRNSERRSLCAEPQRQQIHQVR